ncbi:MAG: glycosyl hydrolase [Alphaproteobacteria bacterium]|nr:glycosyl hydrolase [Alphaproteobacteria bacterium]
MTNKPWMDQSLPALERAGLLVAAMTRGEKLTLVNGHIGAKAPGRTALPDGALGSAGYVPGVARLGIPAQQETDASLGVANLHDGEGATALPSGLALAASWDEALAEEAGRMIGAEAHAKGFNVMLAGGVNLTREPRCGRNFEYLGEDPLLAGVMAGASIRGVQSNGVVSTIKHFILNAQETGRMVLSAEIDEAALRESDLLAFQIGIERGAPGAVMSAYNRLNGAYCGEHDWLLNTVLKSDWGFDGYVMSDWGGCHSGAKAALAGLDQESGQELDREPFFRTLSDAIDAGEFPEARLDDMARRILVPLFRVGAMDAPEPKTSDIPRDAHLDVAQRAAEAGCVLLRNEGALPLDRKISSIALIGANANLGVLAGGGSSSVVPWGGYAREVRPPSETVWAKYLRQRWLPSSPLAALQAAAPNAQIQFCTGETIDEAARAATACEVAIIIAEQWTTEFLDVSDLSLSDNQDALIAAVAAANRNTVVVLITGGAVTMPWRDQVNAILAAWYPGARGAEAIAAILFGRAEPSGRLPLTFPASEADLPNPDLPGKDVAKGRFDVAYPEGADAGYRWFARENRAPLYPFGHGLSYTDFDFAELTAFGGDRLRATFKATNTGARRGAAVGQVYLVEAAGERVLRLIGWAKLDLASGETATAEIAADPRILGRYDPALPGWRAAPGFYRIALGASAGDLRLSASVHLTGLTLPP